ncbi:MAG: hypothetical protein RIR62_1361 [Pseudomonadota bacterium]
MHVQIYPPSRAIDPQEEVEDNLRTAYRTPPPRALPVRLEELVDRLRARDTAPLASRRSTGRQRR